MYSDEFVQFISENWNLFEHLHLSESLLIYFVLKNLYNTILVNLNEFSLVDELTFNSFVSDFLQDKNDNINDSTKSVLFSKKNFLLNENQKAILKIILKVKDVNNEEKSYFKLFRIYYSGQDQERSHILVCESQLCSIVRELTVILFNEKLKPDLNERLALEKCVKYYDLIKDKEPYSKIKTMLESELLNPVNSRILKVTLCFLLLHFNASFSGVSKCLINCLNSSSLSELFNFTLMVNRLILSHPKEVNLWEIKAVITNLRFSRFHLRIKRCVLKKKGGFSTSLTSKNILYSYLVRTIYRLFKDKFILLDRAFLQEVLSMKPYNNNVVCYLKYEYECVVKYVLELFLINLEKNEHLSCNNIFREFRYLKVQNRYKIILSNAIFKLFSNLYKRMLSDFGFPGVFILLVNLIKTRTYSRMQLSVINYSDLYTSSFLYTRVDDEVEEAFSLCNRMIKRDTQNCWIENKTKLILHELIMKMSDFIPFRFDKELIDLMFQFKVVYVLNQHILTWYSFTNSIFSICEGDMANGTVSLKMCKIIKNKKSKVTRKKVRSKIDEYKSEAVQIREFVVSHLKVDSGESNNHENIGKLSYMEGYGFVSVRYIYLESVRILKKFSDFELDCILSSFSQLLKTLMHLFRNVRKLKRKCIHVNTMSFKPLIETVKLVYRYSSMVPRLGSKKSVLVGIGVVKRIKVHARLLFYKYYRVKEVENEGVYYMETIVVILSRLLLSQCFRFYIHWKVASQAKIELLYRQILKLK